MMDFNQKLDQIAWDKVYTRQTLRADLLIGWLKALNVQPGDTILDLGSGPGYFSLETTHLVGPTGKIYAVDQSEEAITYLQEKMRTLGIKNIEPIVSDIRSLPQLEGVSGILLTMVLHHDEEPIGLLRKIAELLGPDSRAIIAEFHPEGPILGGPARERRIDPATLSNWLREAGLEELGYERQNDEHYMVTVKKIS